MSTTRRGFIKTVGIGIASLMITQCTLLDSKIDPNNFPSQSPPDSLRDHWLNLSNLAAETRQNYERGEKLMGDLLRAHRAALNDLVTQEILDAMVADQVQVAFNEAVYHVWRSNAPITCYEPMMLDYTPTSRGQLIQQTALLADLADKVNIDTDTIAQAKAAIERDIAFLNFSDLETQSLYQELMDAAGESYDFPAFDDLEIEISSAVIEAAQLLVDVMLKEQ